MKQNPSNWAEAIACYQTALELQPDFLLKERKTRHNFFVSLDLFYRYFLTSYFNCQIGTLSFVIYYTLSPTARKLANSIERATIAELEPNSHSNQFT